MIVNTIADSASTPYRDDFIFINPDKQHCEDYDLYINELPEQEKALVEALQYRSKIGGLSFDVELFRRMAGIWAWRFAKGGWTIDKVWSYFPTKHNFKYDDVPYAEMSDIMLEGADFHCSPVIKLLAKKQYVIDLIEYNYPGIGVERILQEVIWKMSSGVNFKKQIHDGDRLDWFTAKTHGTGDYFLGEMNRMKFHTIYDGLKKEIDSIAMWFIKKQDAKQEAIPPGQNPPEPIKTLFLF
jgi:hypothetical protein